MQYVESNQQEQTIHLQKCSEVLAEKIIMKEKQIAERKDDLQKQNPS